MSCKGFDEQVVRLDKEIAALADRFVLARVTNMRGVDLEQFDFDYDLTWVGFFVNANGKVYGRFGGRDSAEADTQLTLPGLKHAMRAALAQYRAAPDAPGEPVRKTMKRAEQYPAAARLKAGACIHCHQVYNFEHEARYAAGEWKKELAWVYPSPKNLGITLDAAEQDRVKSVAADSIAARTGLRAGDVLQSVGGQRVASFADVQYALHRAPATGSLPLTWTRDDKTSAGVLTLGPRWREGDLSWRASMWTLPPTASVYGQDLTPEEKQALGLSPQALAFRQGDYVPKPAARAGIRAKDIILGVDERPLEITMLQFNAYIRLNFNVGDRVTYRVLRNGERLKIPLVLEQRDS